MKTNLLFVSLVLLSGAAFAQDVNVKNDAAVKVQAKATPAEKPVAASGTASSATAASANTGGSNIGGKVATATNAQVASNHQPVSQQATANTSVQVQTTVSPAPAVTTVQKVKRSAPPPFTKPPTPSLKQLEQQEAPSGQCLSIPVCKAL
ncbi:hypothetical protein [Paraflavitalea speifideaquila]|uniref:hypothetical protein n=1 Tax=Paraflavitalea speifideaquila TaxID=3076558 RepID=UPI0028F0DCDA|nr:hypothetical protein [Paraflavitalea speifideiaquila]